MVIGAMSCGGWGGGGSSEGGGGRIVSSLTKFLGFLLVFVAPRGDRGEERHPTKPASEHQLKTSWKQPFNLLILLSKFRLKIVQKKAPKWPPNEPRQSLRSPSSTWAACCSIGTRATSIAS